MSVEFVPISLPSKCKPYPNVQAVNVKVRPFKGRDEQLIAEMGTGNPKKKILEVLRNVVQGIDPIQLTVGDVSYIILWEAINSYTNMYPLSLTCENCLTEINVSVDLGKIDSKELSDDYKIEYEVDLPTKKVGLRLLTLGDEIKMMSHVQNNQSAYLYSFALSMIDDLDEYARVLVLEELPTKELAKIRNYHAKFEHGPDYLAPYTCPNCEEEGKVIVPFRLDELIQSST